MRFARYKIVIRIGIAMLAPTILVVAITLNTNSISKKAQFERIFLKLTLSISCVVDKDNSLSGFCGMDKAHFYFRTNEVNKLVITDQNLKNKRTLLIDVPLNEIINSHFDIEIDSPFVIVKAGNVPGIYLANIHSGKTTYYKTTTRLFTRAVKVSSSTYVFRGFDASVKSIDQILIKVRLDGEVLNRQQSLFELINDAGISTDGMLYYDTSSNVLVYDMFYRNQFFVLDTNLSLISKIQTIENIEDQGISTTSVKQANTSTYSNSSPKMKVHLPSSVNNGKVYCYSKIMANNEKGKEFENNSVIDFYELPKGRYSGSIYLPNYKGQKMQSFGVIDDSIIAVYKSYIVKYAMKMITNN